MTTDPTFCLECHSDYLGQLAPAVEAAIETGQVWRRSCGTVVIPDVKQVERDLAGLNPEPGNGYDVLDSTGTRHAWITTDAAA